MDTALDFLEWCGQDYIFCTWGSTDLVELQRNLNHYAIEAEFPMPFLFYDVQKLYSLCFLNGKERPALQTAIEQRGIAEKEQYHMALSDARYTAQLMKLLDFEKVRAFYSIDTYRVPKRRKDEICMNFGNYSKYISRVFDTRERRQMTGGCAPATAFCAESRWSGKLSGLRQTERRITVCFSVRNMG